MDIKVRFNRASRVGWLTTTDMLVWLMFGIFIYFSYCDQASELASTLRIKSRPGSEKSYCHLRVKMKKRISTTKLGPKTTPPPPPPLDPTAAFLFNKEWESKKERESKADKRNYSVERLILCTWCKETQRGMKEQCCVKPARDTLVLHWQGPCSCRAGVPVVWVAEARAGPPDEVFYGLTGTTALCNGQNKSLESRRPISPSTSFPSLLFYQHVHKSLLHDQAINFFFKCLCSFQALFPPFPSCLPSPSLPRVQLLHHGVL